MREGLQRIAQRLKGDCHLAAPYQVRFNHHGSDATLDVTPGGLKPTTVFQKILSIFRPFPVQMTRFRVQGRIPAIRCEVYPDDDQHEPRSLLGLEDLVIGVPDFDKRYVVKTDHLATAQQLLADNTCQQIDALRKLGDIDDVFISRDMNQLTIAKRQRRLRWFGKSTTA